MSRRFRCLVAVTAAVFLLTSLGIAGCGKSEPKWMLEESLPQTADFYGVWGSSSSDVFVVGLDGLILHYDGSAWSTMSSGTTEPLRGVWGSSSADVFAVGESGTILHYDGSRWSAMKNIRTSTNLVAVWGTSSSEVFAVGTASTILRYSGKSWNPMDTGDVLAHFHGVWGSSASDVFVVGDAFVGSDSFETASVVMHYDGGAWTARGFRNTMHMGESLNGVWGNSASEVYAVGRSSTIAEYDGQDWSAYTGDLYSGKVAYMMFPPSLNGVWGGSGEDVFVAGDDGIIVHGYRAEWSTMESGTVVDLNSVWGSSSSDVFAVGMAGTIVHYSQ